jgi:hypothetical protein
MELAVVQNKDLRLEMVPQNLDDEMKVALFAVSFLSSEDHKKMSLEARQALDQEGYKRKSFDSLSEARYYLFLLQKEARWRSATFPDDSVRNLYLLALSEIRRLITEGKLK